MSDYQTNSELSRLNRSRSARVSADLFTVLRAAKEVSLGSGGAFDITLGGLVGLWRTARKSLALPSTQEVSAARKSVGMKFIELDRRNRSVQILNSATRIDLGGIAKGYACDQAIIAMRIAGVRSALIEAGGDMAAGDAPPDSNGWKVNIEGLNQTVEIENQALSTSGSTEQYVTINGRKYSHIVDPSTGLGLTSRRQVTVIGPRGLYTDPWATALCIRPELKPNGLRAISFSRDD